MICRCRFMKILSLIAPLVVTLTPNVASAFICADTTAPGGGGSVSGSSSIACGLSNNSNPEDFSAALGYANSAEKEYSTAVGGLNTAAGAGSTAMGYNNRAFGQDSVAIGSGNMASGVNAFAAGRGSTASGENAIVIGNNSQAMVKNSVALGAQSLTANQHVGVFNIINGGGYRRRRRRVGRWNSKHRPAQQRTSNPECRKRRCQFRVDRRR